jgi:hypothetical protein
MQSSKESVGIKLQLAIPGYTGSFPTGDGNPSAVSEMDCFVVNIKGAEIQGRYQGGQFPAHLGVECLGFAAVSDTMSATTASTSGATLRVRPGSQRSIEVYGIYGSPNCGGKDPAAVFSDGDPALYLMGKVVLDIAGDVTVQVPNSYVPDVTPNRVPQCKISPLPQLAGVGSDDDVLAMSEAADGSRDIYVGGAFTSLSGASAPRFARMSPNGQLVSSFMSSLGAGFDNEVYAIRPYKAGMFYVAGGFNNFNGSPQNGLVRLKPDGTRDTAFLTGTGFTGAGNKVVALAHDPVTERVYVGGSFALYNLTTANGLTALDNLGSPVSGWGPSMYGVGNITSMDLTPDGTVLYVGGDAGSYFAKILTATAAVDSAFASLVTPGANATVRVVKVDPSNASRVYVGGLFNQVSSTAGINRIVRILSTGVIDAGFNIGSGFDGAVNSIVAAGDLSGDIYVGGFFTTYNGVAVPGIVRLKPDGSIRTNFSVTPGPSGGTVGTGIMALLAPPPRNAFNFSLYIGGDFTAFNGVSRMGIARVGQSGLPN